jgi:hypothetical protein
MIHAFKVPFTAPATTGCRNTVRSQGQYRTPGGTLETYSAKAGKWLGHTISRQSIRLNLPREESPQSPTSGIPSHNARTVTQAVPSMSSRFALTSQGRKVLSIPPKSGLYPAGASRSSQPLMPLRTLNRSSFPTSPLLSETLTPFADGPATCHTEHLHYVEQMVVPTMATRPLKDQSSKQQHVYRNESGAKPQSHHSFYAATQISQHLGQPRSAVQHSHSQARRTQTHQLRHVGAAVNAARHQRGFTENQVTRQRYQLSTVHAKS